jgi:hypothetical protein
MQIWPTGITALRARIATATAMLPFIVRTHALAGVEQLKEEIAMAAPVGRGPGGDAGDSAPPPGDAEGKLFESFRAEIFGAEGITTTTRLTTVQPLKLLWVRFGTGIYGPSGMRIYPRFAQALYWPGAPHPYSSIAGMRPYDFVTPILDNALAITGTEMRLAQEDLFALLRY